MNALRKLIILLLITMFSTTAFAVTNNQLFAFAEANFLSIFTGPATVGQYQQYNYQHYPDSGNYLAVDTAGEIFVLGPYTGDVITPVGAIASYANSIQAGAVAPFPDYPAVAVNPRAGFIKGVFTMDVGGFMPDTWAQGLFEPVFDRIRSQVGGNLVAISDPVFVTAYDLTSATVTMSKIESQSANYGMLTREQYTQLVSAAHSRNLQFMLQLGVWPTHGLQLPWGIGAENTAFWDAWFAAYQTIALEYAVIARDLSIDYLSLGMNANFMSQLPVRYWSNLVNAIRAVGYTGKLVYQANTYPHLAGTNEIQGANDGWNGSASEQNAKRLEFVNLFDTIILDVNNIAPNRTSPSAISLAEMQQSFRLLLADASQYPVPVMVMLGTPSVYGGAVDPGYIEPCIPCVSDAPNKQRDFKQQADVYQALAEVINETPTGAGNVVGILSWGYWFTDDYFQWTQNDGTTIELSYDKSANVRGKPAEAVLKWWFDRW